MQDGTSNADWIPLALRLAEMTERETLSSMSYFEGPLLGVQF